MTRLRAGVAALIPGDFGGPLMRAGSDPPMNQSGVISRRPEKCSENNLWGEWRFDLARDFVL